MRIDPDECTACGDCASVCASKAIHSKGAWFEVAPEKCNECKMKDSPQCQEVCPAHCIDYA
ncbi:MAG: 4Fe-4S binding protein [Rhodocyclaceae bacterium]